MKKTFFALLTAACLALSAAVSAQAAMLTTGPKDDQPALPSRIEGVITGETEGSIEVKDSNSERSVVLSVSRDTFILDSETGAAMSLKDRENDVVIVYYGPAETMSLPPRSNALAVFLNSAEELNTPHFAVAEAVEQKEGDTNVLIYNGSQYVVISGDTPIFPYLTRNIVTKEMIRTGTKLALWYGITTLSYPGTARASKAVILAQPSAGTAAESAGASESAALAEEFGGTEYDKNGVTMIPLRIAADARGYKVGWDGETRTVSLEKGGERTELVIGENNYAGAALEYPPEIRNDRTFVPASFLEYLE